MEGRRSRVEDEENKEKGGGGRGRSWKKGKVNWRNEKLLLLLLWLKNYLKGSLIVQLRLQFADNIKYLICLVLLIYLSSCF